MRVDDVSLLAPMFLKSGKIQSDCWYSAEFMGALRMKFNPKSSATFSNRIRLAASSGDNRGRELVFIVCYVNVVQSQNSKIHIKFFKEREKRIFSRQNKNWGLSGSFRTHQHTTWCCSLHPQSWSITPAFKQQVFQMSWKAFCYITPRHLKRDLQSGGRHSQMCSDWSF